MCSTPAPETGSLHSSAKVSTCSRRPRTGLIGSLRTRPSVFALEFVLRGLKLAREGVALLVRSVWLESAERYHKLFADRPPAIVPQFSGRVP
jgi:hypothetical protein